MRLLNEMVLGILIEELKNVLGIPLEQLIVKYRNIWEKYADYSVLRNLLELHEPSENWNLIQRAKMLAIGENVLEESCKNRLLCSVFSNVSVDSTYPKKRYYIPKILNMRHVYPVVETQSDKKEDVSQLFLIEMDSIEKVLPNDFDSFLAVMDTLLKKYFWGVSICCRSQDVSFYDYIKVAMALTATLVLSENEDNPYVIVAGHFSGIQRYIFSAANVGTGGVAKRLRARSFYVNAMVSALAHKIIHEFELSILNILMLTGGKFFVLLPNSSRADVILSELEKETLSFLYERFKGNLSLELVWKPISDTEIIDYGITQKNLSEEIDKKKNRTFESVLIENGHWNVEQFVVYKELANKTICSACKNALINNNEVLCPNCKIDTELGGRLPRIRKFSFSRGSGQYKLLDSYYLNLDITAYEDANYLIMQLNDTDITQFYGKAVYSYYAVNYVPINERGEVKNFEEISEMSLGSKKLGVIKADVDTLGFLFSEGLKHDNNDKVSISRISTMSRMLDIFFGGCVQELIAREYKDTYCVFSGGDDLFFIGPWNTMPKLAIDINERFHKFTGYNSCMTLSAAICMVGTDGHIATLAEECEKKLKMVKNGVDSWLYQDKQGRNGVYFLDKVMSWSDFKEQIFLGDKYAKEISLGMSTSIFRRIADYSRMYQIYMNTEDVNQLMFLPFFSQELRRNKKALKRNDEWIYNQFESLYKKASNYRVLNKEFYYTEFSIRYALLLTREGK